MKQQKQEDRFHELDRRASVIYRFVSCYANYMKTPRDYGNGEPVTMMEIHTLTYIDEHPGVTVTEIASYWNKTKGAVSQIIAKLEEKGWIFRKKEGNNAKNLHCYTSENGSALSAAHKAFDIRELSYTLKMLQQDFSDEEIDTFYKVLQRYGELMESS